MFSKERDFALFFFFWVFCGLVWFINIIIKVWAQDFKHQCGSRTSSPVLTVSHPCSKVHWSSQRQTVTGAVRIFINATVQSKKYGHSYFKMQWIIYSCKNSWKVISWKTLKTKSVPKEIYDGWRFWSRHVNTIVTTWGCIYFLACLVSGCKLQLISEWEQGFTFKKHCNNHNFNFIILTNWFINLRLQFTWTQTVISPLKSDTPLINLNRWCSRKSFGWLCGVSEVLLTVPVRRSSKAVFNYGELRWKKPAQRSEFLGHAAAEVGIRHLVCRGVGTEDFQ